MKTTNLFALVVAIACLDFQAVAQTWSQVTNYDAGCVAMSADGCKLAACTSTVHAMIISTDAGQTWHTNQTPAPGHWPDVGILAMASSADGTKLVARATYDAQIYITANSGSNWTAATALAGSYFEWVCTSALGNILAATAENGLIYVSTNAGLAWTSNAPPNKSWASIASSVDGTKLAAAASSDKIYVSTNFGTTWTATKSPTGSWFSIACNADGTKLIASGSVTYISTNFGANWARASTNTGYVASSADGTKLIIAGGSIYTSSNSGGTWVSNNVPVLGWSSVASSADGSEFMAASYNSGIWIGRTTPSPQLNVEPTITLSWLVPSTNFVLQQNSNLTTTNWATLTNVPSFDPASLQNQVTLPYANGSQEFFRLSEQ